MACAEYAGHFLDLAKLAADAQIARQSAMRYFEVREDCRIDGKIFAIDSKASRHIANTDLRGLAIFADDYGKPHSAMLFYQATNDAK